MTQVEVWQEWGSLDVYPHVSPRCGRDVLLAVLLRPGPLLPSHRGMAAIFMGQGGRGSWMREARELRGS